MNVEQEGLEGSRNKLDAHILNLGSDGSSEGFEGDMVEVLVVDRFLDEGEVVDELEAELCADEGMGLVGVAAGFFG
jgi:hypothetical protein